MEAKKAKQLPRPKKRPLLIMKPMPVVIHDIEETIWRTQTGEEIEITKLSDEHIQNILLMMNHRPGWRKNYRPIIEDEKRRRLSQKSKAGKILYGKI